MKRNLAIVAALLLAGAVSFYFFRKHSQPKPSTAAEDAHRAGLERSTANVTAMYAAPEGATPCETAYNAMKAEQETARANALKSLFAKVADRETFLATCNGLSKEAQICTGPRYMARHRDDCEKLRPPPAITERMVVSWPEDPNKDPKESLIH